MVDVITLLQAKVDGEADRFGCVFSEEVVKSQVLWGCATEVQVIVATWNSHTHTHMPLSVLVYYCWLGGGGSHTYN